MADALVGKRVKIGGDERVLKFNFTALRIAEKKFGGKPVGKILEELSFDAVCELAAAGLLWEDRTMSATRVESWLEADPRKYASLRDAVFDALIEAFNRMAPEKTTPGEDGAPAKATGATTEAAGQTSPG